MSNDASLLSTNSKFPLPAWPIWKKRELHLPGKTDPSLDRYKVY